MRRSHLAKLIDASLGSSNGGLFQRLSGFETGHPAAAGSMPAFVLSVSDEQGAAFLVSVMDCSDCDSSGLDSPNTSWSIARLKEYLRRKKRPSKREKKPSFLNVIISTDIVTSNPSLFLYLFFFSLPFLLVMSHTSHLQERSPTSIALLFLQSCFDAHCVLAYIACWPLDRRILHELYFACAATSRVPPALDKEWFHHLANGSQLHAFSQGRAFLCFVVHAHSIGDRRTETSSCRRKKKKKRKEKNTDGTACAFRERLAFLALP